MNIAVALYAEPFTIEIYFQGCAICGMKKKKLVIDMEKKIKTFVEEYNKRMDWNGDILSKFGKEYVPVHTQAFIKDYLPTDKITEEGFDLGNAKVYVYDDSEIQELQAFNNSTYRTTYFWLKLAEGEDEYKRRKEDDIRNSATDRLNEIEANIAELTAKKTEFNKILKGLNF